MITDKQRAFTLIEILLVVTLLAILAGIVILAINPPRQLAEARNAQRTADAYALLNAVYQYAADHDGELPAVLTETWGGICREGGNCDGFLDLSILSENQKYLATLPLDPSASNENWTGYSIRRSSTGIVSISAPSAELGAVIEVHH